MYLLSPAMLLISKRLAKNLMISAAVAIALHFLTLATIATHPGVSAGGEAGGETYTSQSH